MYRDECTVLYLYNIYIWNIYYKCKTVKHNLLAVWQFGFQMKSLRITEEPIVIDPQWMIRR